MKHLTITSLFENPDFYIEEIKKGKLFIYPTDTIYGLGCDATNQKAVEKIHKIKQRERKPVLVIIPNKDWIEENLELYQTHISEIESKLPGPYSFILNIKNQSCVSYVTLQNKTSLGIRLPDAPFTKLLEKANLPFVSTSVNLSGEPSALSIEDIPQEILDQIDYVIESETKLLGKPSTLIDLRGETPIILRK